MVHIREAIVVEGKYDKIRLASVADALVLETHGFGIFKDKEQLALLRLLAKERGLLILTDSDSAGFVIRGYLNGVIPPDQIKHAYIPEILGREKRKASPSKEGLLGVEGVDGKTILEALKRAGATIEGERKPEGPSKRPLLKYDLFEAGLSGGAESAARRRRFLSLLGLPARLSANRLLEVLNATMSRGQFYQTVRDLDWISSGDRDLKER